MPLFLPASFFVTALLYAMVGFGGGSTYNALLILSGIDYRVVPVAALFCNIVVVAGGVWHFGRSGHICVSRLAPFLYASVPAAWIGGQLPVSETVFVGLLGPALVASGARLLLPDRAAPPEQGRAVGRAWPAAVGGVLGLLAGIVGIGGGIFLAPILYLRRWGRPREIAGAASLFILVNSTAGLAGQLAKGWASGTLNALPGFWPLIAAVAVGGQIGSRLGSQRLAGIWVRRTTAALTLYVGFRLLARWWRAAMGVA